MNIFLAVILVGVLGCAQKPSHPQVISSLTPDLRAKANAILSDDIAPWCKTNAEYDLIVDAKFVSQDRLTVTRSDGYTSTAYLYVFDIVDKIEGTFPHSQLKFIRILNLRDGVKYKLLTLRGTLRFWMTLKDETYTITNIMRPPNTEPLLIKGSRGPKPTMNFSVALREGNAKEVHADLQWPSSRWMRIDDPVNKTGITPLHMAAEYGYLELVKYLLVNGAPVNSFGIWSCCCTPLQLAEKNKHTAIVTFLKNNGAKDYPIQKPSYLNK